LREPAAAAEVPVQQTALTRSSARSSLAVARSTLRRALRLAPARQGISRIEMTLERQRPL